MAAGVHVVALVLFFSVPGLRETVLDASPAEIEEAVQREREAARRHDELKEQRRKQAVAPEHREALAKEIEERRRTEIERAVDEMREARDRMEELEREELVALREHVERQHADRVAARLEDLKREVRHAKAAKGNDEAKERIDSSHAELEKAEAQNDALAEDPTDVEQREAVVGAVDDAAAEAERLAEALRESARERREEAAAIEAELAAAEAAENAAEQAAGGEAQAAKPQEASSGGAEQQQADAGKPSDAGSAALTEKQAKEKRDRLVYLNVHAGRASASAREIDEAAAAARKATRQAVPQTPSPPSAGATAEAEAPAEGASPAELYDAAVELERQAVERFASVRSAQIAQGSNASYEQALAAAMMAPPQRPNLAAALNDTSLGTLADAARLRDDLRNAATQLGLMQADMQQRLAQVDPGLARGTNLSVAPGGSLSGGSTADAQHAGTSTGIIHSKDFNPKTDLTPAAVSIKALPGRRFTDEAGRGGWLYLDTWYMIGPWSLGKYGKTPLPPEFEVDLDAVYQNGMTGRVESPRLKTRFELTGELRWRFVQSESLYTRPPLETGQAIYYAYTEVYSDRDRSVLVAIGIDDEAEVWVNQQSIYHDEVVKWRIGQITREVELYHGYNPILIRMENGAPFIDFSLLLLASD